VCGVGLLSYFTYDHFRKFLTGQYIVDFVNKTSHDKGGACGNHRIIVNTLGRNYLTVGYIKMLFIFL